MNTDIDNQCVDMTENWIRLSLAEIPPRRLRTLLEAYEYNPEALLADRAIHWGMAEPAITTKQASRLEENRRRNVAEEVDALKNVGGNVVTLNDLDYPANLKEITDASPILFVRGHLKRDDKFSVAVVGSRRATMYGLSIAERMAKELSEHGLCVISGGARGIDTRAHRGALDGGGRTVAFIGCGLDVVYPSENKSLFDEIAMGDRGAVVTEFAPGITPEPWRFPARNRLISGMSMATLVIESPIDSGAMITASDAAMQGRDVFAVPGPIETGRSSGCHKLIQEGAKLVESAQDILDELGVVSLDGNDTPSVIPGFRPIPDSIDPEQRALLEMLSLQPKLVDELIVATSFSAPQVVGMLTLLEMRGLARRVPGNAFVRVF